MSISIKVNGTSNSLAHKGNGGITQSTLPDVCKTPTPAGPTPIPYPIIVSLASDLAKGSTNNTIITYPHSADDERNHSRQKSYAIDTRIKRLGISTKICHHRSLEPLSMSIYVIYCLKRELLFFFPRVENPKL